MMTENLGRSGPDLTGKVAVVTGAGRGIGRAIAIALAEHGADVAIAARTLHELNAVAENIQTLGRRCCVVPTDVTVPAQCTHLIQTAAAELGAPDVLINNAGSARFKPIWDYTDEEIDFHYAVNYRSMHVCTREALRYMLPRKSGTIINIASSSGKKPYLRQGPYCAMKAAAISLSKVLAMETRDYGIRVHVICPGAVDTAMAEVVHPERDRTGWLQPEDIARTVLDLLALPAHLTVDEVIMRRYLAEPM